MTSEGPLEMEEQLLVASLVDNTIQSAVLQLVKKSKRLCRILLQFSLLQGH